MHLVLKVANGSDLSKDLKQVHFVHQGAQPIHSILTCSVAMEAARLRPSA
jgi:hypothetical protein